MYETNDMSELLGRVPTAVDQKEDEIVMTFADGSSARWWHEQYCCEDVSIEDVVGDWSSLIGHPLLVAEERTSDDTSPKNGESGTWTFYTFRGVGGSVDVRWYGSSNGYYSESVSFELTAPPVTPIGDANT